MDRRKVGVVMKKEILIEEFKKMLKEIGIESKTLRFNPKSQTWSRIPESWDLMWEKGGVCVIKYEKKGGVSYPLGKETIPAMKLYKNLKFVVKLLGATKASKNQ